MKKIIISTLLVILFSSAAYAVDIPKPTNDSQVNDFANLLTPETSNKINEVASELKQKTNIRAILVTVEDTEGVELGGYAKKLFSERKIGEGGGGVLFLVTPNGAIFVSNLPKDFNPGTESNDIYLKSDMKNLFGQGKYNTAIYSAFVLMCNSIAKKHDATLNIGFTPREKALIGVRNIYSYAAVLIIIVFILLIIKYTPTLSLMEAAEDSYPDADTENSVLKKSVAAMIIIYNLLVILYIFAALGGAILENILIFSSQFIIALLLLIIEFSGIFYKCPKCGKRGMAHWRRGGRKQEVNYFRCRSCDFKQKEKSGRLPIIRASSGSFK